MVLDVVRKAIRGVMNDLSDTVARGGAASYDEYRHITGQIEGLARAERIVSDLIDAHNKGFDVEQEDD